MTKSTENILARNSITLFSSTSQIFCWFFYLSSSPKSEKVIFKKIFFCFLQVINFQEALSNILTIIAANSGMNPA